METNRRALIGATAALAGATALNAAAIVAAKAAAPASATLPPLQAIADPDAPLRALMKSLKAANRRAERAYKKVEAAIARMEHEGAQMPPIPEEPRPPAELAEMWKTIPWGEFKMLPQDHPLVVWDRETLPERRRIWNLKSERDDLLTKSSGHDDLHEAWEHILHNEMVPLARKIWATPAQTFEGLAIKIEAAKVVGFVDAHDNEQPWRSLRRDVRRVVRSSARIGGEA